MADACESDRNGASQSANLAEGASSKHTVKKSRGVPFSVQANALMRKNVTYQRKNWRTNLCLVFLPAIMSLLLFLLEKLLNRALASAFNCGCGCPGSRPSYTSNGTTPNLPPPPPPPPVTCSESEKVCGPQYSTTKQLAFCPLTEPPQWPAFMQVPRQLYRASDTPTHNYSGLPPQTCHNSNASSGCPTTILYTGQNRTLAQRMGSYLLNNVSSDVLEYLQGGNTINNTAGAANISLPKYVDVLSILVPGSAEVPGFTLQVDSALVPYGARDGNQLYYLVNNCSTVPSYLQKATLSVTFSNQTFPLNIECLTTYTLFRQNTSDINSELYNGFFTPKYPTAGINEYTGAYDFQNTSSSLFNPVVFYNRTFYNFSYQQPSPLFRIARPVNLATNAYVKAMVSSNASVPLLFIKNFPRPSVKFYIELTVFVGPLFYVWILQLLLPVMVNGLVYEREKRLRTMMSMHGLTDGPYWLVAYAYFFLLSLTFVLIFLGSGAAFGAKMIRSNSALIQLVFYFVFLNSQISFAIFLSTLFSTTKVSTVVSYLYVFASGLLSEYLFHPFLLSTTFSTVIIQVLEIFPAFALYRGLYELSSTAYIDEKGDTSGTMTWSYARQNGLLVAILILAVEWAVFLALGLLLDFLFLSGAHDSGESSPASLTSKMHKSMKKWFSSLTSCFSSPTSKKKQQQGVNSSSSGGKNDAKGKAGLQASKSSDSTTSSLALSSFPRCTCTHFNDEDSEELLANGENEKDGGERESEREGEGEGEGEGLGEAGRSESIKEALSFVGHHRDGCPIRTTVLKKGDVMYRDVAAETLQVEYLLSGKSPDALASHPIICNDLWKVYSGGGRQVSAVAGMSLAVGKGECFGLLGPSGAGKTTSLHMMMGFTAPTAGTALVNQVDISQDVRSVYTMIGVCPQHDLLWEQLTGREHLLFYGRLKNLNGAALREAVDDSLQQVNLLRGGVGDKPVASYSGGMKRRLSVAISLIGQPPVVFMDEPSTGLDPASRHSLWQAIKNAKKSSCIMLTTHSMEEAEILCDRIGIFVAGRFKCVGAPRQLVTRFGGRLILTLTTPIENESDAAKLATKLNSKAKCVYRLAGTQKFELPSSEVDVDSVFAAVSDAKARLGLRAWGLAHTTLEDVFISISSQPDVPPTSLAVTVEAPNSTSS